MKSLQNQMENLNLSVDKKFENLHKRLDINDVRVTKLEELVFQVT